LARLENHAHPAETEQFVDFQLRKKLGDLGGARQ